MITVTTAALDLLASTVDSDPAGRVHAAFPINDAAGSEHSAVVYFELEPGDHLPRHTDSAEEILYIVAGEAEVEVGDERGRLAAGDLAVVPEMVPHGLRNVGVETVKVVGFFAREHVTSTFDEPLQPHGVPVVTMGNVPAAV